MDGADESKNGTGLILDIVNESNSWWLVGTPLPVVCVLVYLGLVFVGKRWMSKRPAYELTTAMRVYDLCQVTFNVYMVYGFVINPDALPLLLFNNCYADSTLPKMEELNRAFLYYCWCYLLSKILDLFDTIFMVLRKKNSHITFLHVYHHVAMVFFTWVSMRYAIALQAAFPGFLNEIVHIIMYSYYFLATFPQLAPYLGWKRHLTKLQLIQFLIVIMYIGRIYYNGCPISKVFTFIWLFNISVIFCLFINFYLRSYILKSKKIQQKPNKRKQKRLKQQ